MLFPVLFGVSIVVVSFSGPVIGDPTAVIIIKSTKVTQNDCGYIGEVTIDPVQTKKSSQLNMKFPITKELPPTMMISFTLNFNDADVPPVTQNMTLCDAWSEPTVGKSLIASGTPKETFPKACPFLPGPWALSKWNPPTDLLPPGLPPSSITGKTILFTESGKICVTMDYVGELKRDVPAPGR